MASNTISQTGLFLTILCFFLRAFYMRLFLLSLTWHGTDTKMTYVQQQPQMFCHIPVFISENPDWGRPKPKEIDITPLPNTHQKILKKQGKLPKIGNLLLERRLANVGVKGNWKSILFCSLHNGNMYVGLVSHGRESWAHWLKDQLTMSTCATGRL